MFRGADVNALWNGYFPVLFAPCETVEPASLKRLLDHGADPNCPAPRPKYPGTALDYVISTYGRSPELGNCINTLLEAGGTTKHSVPPVLDLLRGRIHRLAGQLDADPALLDRRFPELDFGVTGTRLLTLRGATLLHVAAEYGNVEAAKMLLDRGAEVNALAALNQSGVGGPTPIFHAVTQFNDAGRSVVGLLLERGADLSVRAKLPGYYERPEEVVECTPLGYALQFPGLSHYAPNPETCALLRDRGAPE